MSNSTSLKGGGYLVLYDLYPGAGADNVVPLFQRRDFSDIHPDRGVELEGVTPRGGLRVAKHDANLHPDLIDEDDCRMGFADDACQFAQCLGHEASLESHVGISHVSLDLRFGNQGCHRVHHEDVDSAAADEHFGDLQSLFPGVGLGYEEVVGFYSQFAGIADIQGVLGVDEGGDPPFFHRLGDDV